MYTEIEETSLPKTPDPKSVMRVGDRLIKAKAELLAAQAEWNAVFGIGPSVKPLVRGSSGKGKIVALLTESPEKEFDAESVSETLKLPVGTVRTTLSKLVTAQQIQTAGRGLYKAKVLQVM